MGDRSLGFPFRIADGRLKGASGDDAIRARIIQVLFTTPGERVNEPEFGCGLLNLLFEPANEVLAAAVEFSIGQALLRWLSEDLYVDAVQVSMRGSHVTVELTYTMRETLVRQGLRLRVQEPGGR